MEAGMAGRGAAEPRCCGRQRGSALRDYPFHKGAACHIVGVTWRFDGIEGGCNAGLFANEYRHPLGAGTLAEARSE